MGKLIRDDKGFEYDGPAGEMLMTPSSARAAAILIKKIDRFMAKVTDGHMYSVYISIMPFFNPGPPSRSGVSAFDAGGAFMISVDRIGCAFLSLHQTHVDEYTIDKYFPGFRNQFGESFTKLFIQFLNMIGKYIRKEQTYHEGLRELIDTNEARVLSKKKGSSPMIWS